MFSTSFSPCSMATLFKTIAVVCVTSCLGDRSCPQVMAISIDVSDSFVYVATDGGAGGYEAFPDVTRLQDGRLMAVFYAGYAHISPPNQPYPNGGRIGYSLSENEGVTWSQPSMLYDTPSDDRDPSITQLADGRLLGTYFHIDGGTWSIISENSGSSWSVPKQIAPGNYYTSSPVRELTSGRLVAPLYHEAGGVANGAVSISDNGGDTWSAPIDFPNPNNIYFDAEVDVIELDTGNFWAIQRSSHFPAHSTVSADEGATWSDPQSLGFVAHSPYLTRTTHGDLILLGYRGYHSLDGSGNAFTALRYSLDECLTWSDPIVIDTTAGAYPSMVNLNDGSVLIAYYEEGSGSNVRTRVLTISGIPEPSTVSLLATGLMYTIGLTRRTQRKSG